MRVDHVENYRLPKHLLEKEDQVEATIITKNSATGHAYQGQDLANEFNLDRGQDLFAPPTSTMQPTTKLSITTSEKYDDDESSVQRKERKRHRKKDKHRKRSHKDDRKHRHHQRNGDQDDEDNSRRKRRKHRDR